MRMQMKRPLMVFSIIWLIALAGTFLLSGVIPTSDCYIEITIACGAGVLLSAAVFFFGGRENRRKRRKTAFFILLSAVLIFCAFLRADNYIEKEKTINEKIGNTVTLTGKTERLSYVTDYSAGMQVSVTSIDGKKISCKLLLNASVPVYAAEGETFTCTAVLTEPEWEREERLSYFSKGIIGEAEIREEDSFLTEEQGKPGFSELCDKIALECKIRAREYLSARDAGVLCGILLGDKQNLAADIKRDFRRAGISHVLAVSGMHISILLGGLAYLLRMIRVPKKTRLVLMLAFLLVFMGVAGFPRSLVRAGLMWGMTLLAFFLGGRNDSLTALFFAAAVITAISPNAVFDVGLMLSVSATLGILVLGLPTVNLLREHLPKRLGRYLLPVPALLLLSLAAVIFTFPVSALVFGEISLVGPAANLAVQIPVTAILFIGPFLILAALLPFSAPARLLASALRQFIALLLWVTRGLASLKSVLIGIRYPFLLPILFLFLVLSFVLLRSFRRVWVLYPSFALCIAVFALCLAGYRGIHSGDIWVDYRVSGKNDCIALVTCDKGMLIDCSDGSYNALYRTWRLLSDDNMTEIDTVTLTHYHKKHVASLARLSEETVIRGLLLPEPETEEEREILEELRKRNIVPDEKIVLYRRGGQTVGFGPAGISFFPRAVLSRSVQPLLAFQVKTGENALLYVGASVWECKEDTYREMLANAASESDKLLFGIHGPNIKEPIPFPDTAPVLCAAANETLLAGMSDGGISMEQIKHLFFALSD